MFELKRVQSAQGFSRTTGMPTDQTTTTAYADGALSSELRTSESPRYLQHTGPKPGQQMPGSWEARAGESSMR